MIAPFYEAAWAFLAFLYNLVIETYKFHYPAKTSDIIVQDSSIVEQNGLLPEATKFDETEAEISTYGDQTSDTNLPNPLVDEYVAQPKSENDL